MGSRGTLPTRGLDFRAAHAIFVREGAENTYNRVDEVPEVMRTRLLSLRAYDADGMMLDADVVDDAEKYLHRSIERNSPKLIN